MAMKEDKGSNKGVDGTGRGGPKDSPYTAATDGVVHGEAKASSGDREDIGPNPGHVKGSKKK